MYRCRPCLRRILHARIRHIQQCRSAHNLSDPGNATVSKKDGLIFLDNIPSLTKLYGYNSNKPFNNSYAYIRLVESLIDTGQLTEAYNMLKKMLRGKEGGHELAVVIELQNALLSQMDAANIIEKYHALFRDRGIKPSSRTVAIVCRTLLLSDDEAHHATAREIFNKYHQFYGDGRAVFEESDILAQAQQEKLGEILLDLESRHREATTNNTNNTTFPSTSSNIKAVESRSEGLRFLKTALAPISSLTNTDAYTKQEALEASCVEAALQQWEKEAKEDNNQTINRQVRSIDSLLWDWHSNFVKVFEAQIDSLQDVDMSNLMLKHGMDKAEERIMLSKFLRLLPIESMSVLTTLEALRLSTEPALISDLISRIGRVIEREVVAKRLLTEHKKSKSKEIYQIINSHKKLRFARREMYNDAKSNNDQDRMSLWTTWTNEMCARIGAFLFQILQQVATLETTHLDKSLESISRKTEAAFIHEKIFKVGDTSQQSIGYIRMHEILIEAISKAPVKSNLQSRFLPMLVPPKPWTEFDEGGYLFTKSSIVRSNELNSIETVAFGRAASKLHDLDVLYEGLNSLGQVPWRINDYIYEIAAKLWNSGIECPSIPPEAPSPKAQEDNRRLYKGQKMMTKDELEIQKKLTSNHSMRCDVNYKLETAKAFKDQIMYFPHNIDFRGRAYPLPITLNHMGNDLSRALLHFSTGKELGERGLFWLKVHIANVYKGYKVSLEERAQIVDGLYARIKDTVKNPLSPDTMWLKADDPWQFLAAAQELVAAVESKEPTKFVSRIPVAMDGSCNGLQHYAALGCDYEGAFEVNLVPRERPGDIYSRIAEHVRTVIEKDANDGNSLALLLKKRISRSVVKQTVMTSVYGVTFLGARDQVMNQIRRLENFPAEETANAAIYIAKLTLDSIANMFSSANEIKKWLTFSAKLISKSASAQTPHNMLRYEDVNLKSQTVIWTSPVGHTNVQPYRAWGHSIVKTILQDVRLRDSSDILHADPRKQASAFPPNYVHSLDAAHMLMTAIECTKNGLTFAAVHDSFWTHAADVDLMNKELRDQFVKLYKRDLLAELREQFQRRYRSSKMPITHSTITQFQDMYGDKFEPLPKLRNIKLEDYDIEEILYEVQPKSVPKSNFAAKSTIGRPISEVTDGFALLPQSADEQKKGENDDEEVAVTSQREASPTGKTIKYSGLAFHLGGKRIPLDQEVGYKLTRKSDGKEYIIRQKGQNVVYWMDIEFPPLPKKGIYSIESVLASKYFFS